MARVSSALRNKSSYKWNISECERTLNGMMKKFKNAHTSEHATGSSGVSGSAAPQVQVLVEKCIDAQRDQSESRDSEKKIIF